MMRALEELPAHLVGDNAKKIGALAADGVTTQVARSCACMIYGMIVFLHGIAYCDFRYIWPEVFT